MDFVNISDSVIDVNCIIQKVTSPKCGAISLFVGTTRDNFNGLHVTKLVYEVYESMAVKALKDVCYKIRCNWPEIVNIAIYHRTGEVTVGEASVAIAISSPHRPDSLAAVSFAIEELKATVPIWKKEEYLDSESSWKQNKECKWAMDDKLNNTK